MSGEKKKALKLFLFGLLLLAFCGFALAYFLRTGDEQRVFPMSLCLAGSVLITLYFGAELLKTK